MPKVIMSVRICLETLEAEISLILVERLVKILSMNLLSNVPCLEFTLKCALDIVHLRVSSLYYEMTKLMTPNSVHY